MQVALGRIPEEEPKDNTHLLSKVRIKFIKSIQYLKGNVCLLFTNKTEKQLKEFFKLHEEPDFAKSGQKATFTVLLEKGTDALQDFSHSMET